MRQCLWSVLLVFCAGILAAQPIGIFDDQADVGEPEVPGIGDFSDGTYTVDAVGEGIGTDNLTDQFHFVYSELSGSFSITASPFDAGGIGRGGLMVRHSLDADAPHASLMMTGDLNVWPHIRYSKGGGTILDGDPEDDTTVSVRLERLGNTVNLYRINGDGSEDLLYSEVIYLEDPVYAGLAATGDGQFGFFEFSDVSIEEYPLNVMRSMPDTDFEPGASFSPVTLTATVRDGETVNATVNEVVPRGSSISNVQASAGEVTDNGDGTIDWALNNFSGEATLTYDVTLPNRESVAWPGTFNDGIHDDGYIGGVSVLPLQPEFRGPPDQPFEFDPFFPIVIQIEEGENIADVGAFGLAIDPRIESGIFVINVSAGSGDLIEIPFTVPEDGTYYLFGNVRGEDGNSDSWHFDIDIPPDGTDYSRWNVESPKAFELDWVEQEDPSQDPRPFELTAGEHYMYLAGREDSSSMDWIAITNNPNLDLGSLDLDAEFLVSRSISDNFLENDETSATVEVQVVLKSTVTDSVTIQEMPPANFEVSNVNASDGNVTENADGSISWDVTGLTRQELILQYEVTPPPPTGPLFSAGEFEGEFAIADRAPVDISGDDTVVAEGMAAVDPTGQVAYLFMNVGDNLLGDQLYASHLRNQFGLDVQRFDDGNAAGFEMPGDLSGADFALISGSVGSGNIVSQNYHFDSPVPIITYEGYVFDDYAFQPDVGRGSSGGTELEIVDNTHPITEGLDLGVHEVYSTGSGFQHLTSVPDGLRVLATIPGEPDTAVLWVVEEGAEVNGTVSPGIRIAFFSGSLVGMNSMGIDLFNRVVAYVLDTEPPEPPVSIEQFMLY